MLSLMPAVAALAVIGPPLRLRADGVAGTGHAEFPVDLMPVFEWAPQHTERQRSQAFFRVTVHNSTGVVWDSGNVSSSLPRTRYPADAPALAPGRKYMWRVKWADDAGAWSDSATDVVFWTALAADQWSDVPWLGDNVSNVYRGRFTAPEGLADVSLWVAGLSFSAVEVNGKAPDERVLVTSPWTNAEFSVGYSLIQIPGALLQKGENIVGVTLGYGWRDKDNKFPRHDPGQTGYDNTLRVVRAQVWGTPKGSSAPQLLGHTGDGTWKAAAGPIVADSLYDGETYDARKELTGWSLPGYDDSAWSKAVVDADPPRGVMLPWTAPSVAVSRTVKPVSSWKVNNTFVLDFGTNLAAVCEIRGMKGAAGTVVTFKHAEILQHEGLPGLSNPNPKMIYQANLRSAKATDTYTMKGDAAGENYRPSMTYHGFRYVAVDGLESLDGIDIVMHHFHSAVPQRAHTNFSSPTMQRIAAMALGAQRSNMMTLFTDCPQRDERLGWMGDVDLSSDAIAAWYDAGSFMRWYSAVIRTEQASDGNLPDTVPWVRYGRRPADASWSVAALQVPWILWKTYNDTASAAEFLDMCVRQIRNLEAQASGPQGIKGLNAPYGDWCPPPAKMGGGRGIRPPSAFTQGYSYIDGARKVADMAQALGNQSVAAEMQGVAQKAAQEFNTAFWDAAKGTYGTGLQTELALPLALGLSPDMNKSRAQLYAAVNASNFHFNTGIIGLKSLFNALYDAGSPAASAAILDQTDYPSIGYEFANTEEPASENLWELPDAPREGTGMNSRNHHMYSSYSHYLLTHVAGVDQKEGTTGQRQLRFRTMAGGALDISWASATVDTAGGTVSHRWQRSGGAQCGKASEGDTVQLSCGEAGGLISEVRFASFGAPTGGLCRQNFGQNDQCHAKSSLDVLRAACIGKAECSVPANATLFGFGSEQERSVCGIEQPLRLWADVECSEPSTLRAQVQVPVGAEAELRLPSTALNLTRPFLFESGVRVEDGKWQLRTETSLSEGGSVVVVNVGSGEYDFRLTP